MKIITFAPCLYLLFAFYSCKTNDTGLTPQPGQSDPAKYILMASRGASLTTTLTCFNADKSVRWRRDTLGNGGHPNAFYAKGLIYYSVGYFAFTSGNSYISYNNFYAIDPESGKDVWTILKSDDYINGKVMWNDVLICESGQSNKNFITAYDGKKGTILWRKEFQNQRLGELLSIDGNTLYILSAPTSLTNNVLNAFDLTTKEVKWQQPIGPSIGNYPSLVVVSGDVVCLKNGQGALLAFDKNTGAKLWQKDGSDYNQPIVKNNLFYVLGPGHNIYAINPADGNVKFQCLPGTEWASSQPYVSANSIYMFGTEGISSFIYSWDDKTGTLNWKTGIGPICQSAVAAGENIYALKPLYLNTSSATSQIMIFDANKGNAKDSISLAGDEFSDVQIITSSGDFLLPAGRF